MYTTTTPDGLLNNYAMEPQLYYAAHPSVAQQRDYLKQAAFAAFLIVATLCVAVVAS